MSSLEVLANGQLESFDSSEFSLIPEQPPLGMEEAANHEEHGQLDMSNMQSAFRSATLDLSVEEIQSRLVELVEDNETMKEALKLNNTMMKEQLSTISAWHNQMTTSMSQQQMSLTEAKTRVLELEKENAQLSEKLEESQRNPKTVTDNVTCTREDKVVVSDEEIDFEIVSQKKDSKENMLLKSQLRDASVKITDLQKELDKQKNEILHLRKDHEQKVIEIGSLQREVEDHKELKQRSESLLQEIADHQTNTKVVQVLEEAKIKSLESKCEELQKKVDKYKSLELPMSDIQAPNECIIKGLESKVKDLEEKLMKEQHVSQVEKLRHGETMKLLSVLQANYDRVTKLLQTYSKDERGMSEYEMQTRQFLEQIDSLTAKLFDMEQTLEERENKVKELTSELNTLKEDSETIPILKAQVEVYKTDLNSTMLARDSAHEEVERLTKQMQDMQQPGASFCVNCGAGADAISRNKGRKKTHLSRQPESQQVIICPVCQFGFTDLQAAENHVNNCIDKAQ